MASDGREVDVADLSPEQLQQLHRALQEELQALGSNLNALRIGHARYFQSLGAVKSYSESKEATPMLVPLTSSLYVPGQVDKLDSLLVDIGTGYFLEKNIKSTEKYLNDKTDMLAKNIEKVSQAVLAKRKDVDTVGMVLQAKVNAIRQYQMEKAATLKAPAVTAS